MNSDRPMTPSERREHIEKLEAEAIQRPEFSDGSREAFHEARDNEDVQAQIDVLYHVMTGERPE
jgi:hypothetical protein